MNWSKGFSARYYITLVDPVTWRDTERFEIISGNISRSGGTLMEAADLDAVAVPGNGDVWIRIHMDARQEGAAAHEALFTGLMTAPAVSWNGNRKSYRVECYSVLKPAADVLLQRGWYAPAEMNGAELAARLLSIGTIQVEYEDNAPALASNIIAENNESNLSMAQKILDAIGWRIRISGMGQISICPQADTVSETFGMENDCIELAVTDNRDWFSCPNVFRAVSDGLTAVARDDDEESPLSTVSRGREIWMEETSCNLNENESIAEYAVRRLKEEQSPSREISYNRRFFPDLYIGDMVRIHYPGQNIDSDFRITSQQIELGYGARTAEGAIQV